MELMIRTEKLTKDYGGGRGVQDLNMEVPANSVFGYIGPNGSGKSTTIKMVCGLVAPTAGKAWVNGIEVNNRSNNEIKKLIGYLPDEFGVYDQMTVWEYLDFFGAAYRIEPKKRRMRIDEVLELTGASHMLDYQVNSLSRGMHQKIGIAKTMLHDPQLLILDEPANGLDPYARIDMRNTILRLKEIGKTVVLSSHILPELGAICDLVGIIEKGRMLVQGPVKEITRSLQQHIVLDIQVDSDLEKAANCCKEFPNIFDVTTQGTEVRVEYRGARTGLADLSKHLIDGGVRVLTLKEVEIDLENVFLTVTGKDRSATERATDKVKTSDSTKSATSDAESAKDAKPKL